MPYYKFSAFVGDRSRLVAEPRAASAAEAWRLCAGSVRRSLSRAVVESIDIAPVMDRFLRWCALQVIGKWDAPAVVIEFLETGDESMRDSAKAAVGEVRLGATPGPPGWAVLAAFSACAGMPDAPHYAARALGERDLGPGELTLDQAKRLQELVDEAFNAMNEDHLDGPED